MPGINALLLGSVLYLSRLVPRSFPLRTHRSPPADLHRHRHAVRRLQAGLPELAALPVAARELSLGVWLVVKGFRPSPITAGMTAADSVPAYHDVTA